MSDFGFNGMSDEEFNKEFLRFLNMYQSGLESFMKKNLGPQNNSFFGSNPMNIEPFDMDSLRKILSQLNDDMGLEKGNDENGEGEKRNWLSPDGSTSFSSFSRNQYFNPFEGRVSKYRKEPEIDTMKLLTKKLNQAISDEKYEEAAKIRDLIKSLGDDKK